MFGSSHIVNATLILLFGFSVIAWGIVFFKVWEVAVNKRNDGQYAEAFWASPSLIAALELAEMQGAMSRIGASGLKVLHSNFWKIGTGLAVVGKPEEILERHLRQSIQMERLRAERGLMFLASIGSTAPFVGLFGTVWGIMHALQDISLTGSAGLDVVAGPIGEALIATAIGIASAIPAVLAYNFFLRQTRLYETELENFATDFLHLAMRSGFSIAQGE